MTENENVETENELDDEYVTRSQLEALLDEKLESFVDRFTGDSLPETETTEELDEAVGNLSASEIEKLFEQKVAAAMEKLTAKKAARPAPKKAAPKAAPKPTPKAKEAPEETPSLPGKKSLSERLWGTK